jgi:hypothetical protein
VLSATLVKKYAVQIPNWIISMHGKLADISMENFAFSQRIIKLQVREVQLKTTTLFRIGLCSRRYWSLP